MVRAVNEDSEDLDTVHSSIQSPMVMSLSFSVPRVHYYKMGTRCPLGLLRLYMRQGLLLAMCLGSAWHNETP